MSRAEAPDILNLRNDYKRQYLGIVVDGKRLIVANFDRCSIFAEEQLERSLFLFCLKMVEAVLLKHFITQLQKPLNVFIYMVKHDSKS